LLKDYSSVTQPSLASFTLLWYLYKAPFLTGGGGWTQFFLRSAISSSLINTLISFLIESMRITSLSFIKAILPPSHASGAICPTTKPWVPPEKRPSVIKATDFPKPAPIIAEVGFNISGIHGAPFGPTWRITTTSPE